jgi:tetraacyldisaccharide 4'-kinase
MPSTRASAPAALWTGDGPVARALRATLAPASGVYAAASALRSWGYDRGWLPIYDPSLPAIAVGNLTVGGTGKTPVAAWVAGALAARGAHPGIVLRGYRGDDEAQVHRILHPDVPVVTDPDRRLGVNRARALGCDVAVLDDAFQHRRVRRMADLVLVSADAWPGGEAVLRLLPAGPWREPLRAARRASVVIVTRKAAPDTAVDAVVRALAGAARDVPVAIARLALGELRSAGGETRPLDILRDAPVYAIAGVGDPDAFFAQLRALTPRLHTEAFPDHHRYTVADATRLAESARRCGEAGTTVVCTLKDAVKLAAVWPRAAPEAALWFVSQRVVFERGRETVEATLDAVLRARSH